LALSRDENGLLEVVVVKRHRELTPGRHSELTPWVDDQTAAASAVVSLTRPDLRLALSPEARGQVFNLKSRPDPTMVGGLEGRGKRLNTSSLGGSYLYDGHGRRIRVASSDGSVRMQVYGQAGQLLWSTSTGGPRPTSTTAYIYLGGKQIAEWNSVNGTQYVHTDALGSPVAHTNAGGALINRTRFEPYGYVAAGTKPGPATSLIGFTGHVQDAETDLVYMQQRYYDPIAGRFLSVDPVVTDVETGKLFGRYHYGENNPYKYKDPDGRVAIPLIPLIVEAVAAAVASNAGAAAVGIAGGVAIGAAISQSSAGSAAPAPGADEGCIYCVSGTNTSSGKDYVGSTDNMGERQKDSSDGRNRKGAEVVGTYPKGDRETRRRKEQQEINNRGGKEKLDNKRDEVDKKKWEEKKIDPPKKEDTPKKE
jgi:RHS repeat-associated protein